MLLSLDAAGQQLLDGIVKDKNTGEPIEAVSIINKQSAKIAISVKGGIFHIIAEPGDTLNLRILGYYSSIYIVHSLNDEAQIALKKKPYEISEVVVKATSYKKDSLAQRNDFDTYFNYKAPKFKDAISTDGGIGLNIDKLYDVLSFRRKKKNRHFQKELIQAEQSSYIRHRYTVAVVKKITNMPEDSISLFMKKYQPAYSFLKTATDYELYVFIKQSYLSFIKNEN